jgi:hypothetical protein
MKSLSVILLLTTSLNLLACQFSIVEQDSKFFLVLKRVGELPDEKEKIKQRLRRGLQEVKVKKKDEKEDRSVRLRVIHDSNDRESLEKILRSRCSTQNK